MRNATLRFLALIVGVLLIGSGGSAQGQGAFAHGTVVALQGTPHLWIADAQGVLHWGGDTRALAGKHVNWNDRRDVSLAELQTYPIGDPWLSAGLLKDGDPIYQVKWESEWPLPKLLHIQSIKDVELFGINGSNYGHFVIDKAAWEQRYGIDAASLERQPLASAVPPGVTLTLAPVPAATPEADIGSWKLRTVSDSVARGQPSWWVDLSLRSTTYEPQLRALETSAYIRIQCLDHNYRPGTYWETTHKVFIDWGERFVAARVPQSVPVQMRFGNESTVTSDRWKLTERQRHTVVPTDYQIGLPGAFLPRLQESNRFAATVTKPDGTTITATWDTSGVTPALRQLQEHCPARYTPTIGNWRGRFDEDRKQTVFRLASAHHKYGLQFGGRPASNPFPPSADLTITCWRNRYSVHIQWRGRIYDDRMPLRFGSRWPRGNMTFGNEGPIEVEWELFKPPRHVGHLLFPQEYRDGAALIARLLQSNRFVVRVFRPDRSPIYAFWDTTGLANVLRLPIAQKHCPTAAPTAP